MFQNHVMCWEMELANCWYGLLLEPCVVLMLWTTMCVTCYVTESQEVVWPVFVLVVVDVKKTSMCVTGAVSQEPRCCVAVYLHLRSGELTSCSKGKMTTSNKHYSDANIPFGTLTGSTSNKTNPTGPLKLSTSGTI